MATTLKAIKRVQEIKAKRERVFYKNRMAGKKEQEKAENRVQVQQNIELLDAVDVKEKLQQTLARQAQEKDTEMA